MAQKTPNGDPEARQRAGAPAIQDWEPELTVEASPRPRQWDGTMTRLPIAAPMMRDHRIIGQGDSVVFAAAYDKEARRWYGPEASHVEELFKQGMILGSRQAEARAAQAAAIENARGVYQEEVIEDGRVVQRPMLEFKQRTTEQVQREWERVLGRGPQEAIRMERQEARSGGEGAEELAAALTRLVSGGATHPGAEGPGTGPLAPPEQA